MGSQEKFAEGLLAAMIQKEITVRLDWITEQLNMRTPAGILRLTSEVREHFVADQALGRKIETMSNTVNIKWLAPAPLRSFLFASSLLWRFP